MVALSVETKPAAEDVYAADFMSGQGVGSSAVVRRRSRVSGGGVHGVAVLQSVKAAAGLNRGIKIRGGKSQASSLAGAATVGRSIEAESIGGIGLLRGNDA